MEYKMDNIKKITLDDWEKVGGGGNADSYFNKKDDTIMLKLSKATPRNIYEMNEEIKIAKIVNQIDINTPKMICEVECDGRKGIIYEKLKGKKSIAQLCHENPDKIEYYAKVFANELYKLHNTKCDIEDIPNYKEKTIKRYSEKRHEDKLVDVFIKMVQNDIEDLKCCIHGDPTMGNLIFCQGKYYWIDTGKFSYGDFITDLVTIYFSYQVLAKFRFVQKIFHLDYDQLKLFGVTLLKEYAKLENADYDKLIERIEKLSVMWCHGIWITAEAPRFIKWIAKCVATKYQRTIDKKYNL